MSDLIAIAYEDEKTAFNALDKIGEMQKMQLIELADAAVAVKDQKGKVKVKQTLENAHTGGVALWGGFWGLLIGLLAGSPESTLELLLPLTLGAAVALGRLAEHLAESFDWGEDGVMAAILLTVLTFSLVQALTYADTSTSGA